MTKADYNRRYREKNRELLKQKALAYYASRREQLLEDTKFRYRANRRKILKRVREDYRSRKEYILAYNKMRRVELRVRVLEMLGAKCACCGESEHDFLEVDHIHGGGNKHFEELGTWGVLRQIRDDPNRAEKFRVLCSNCNKARSRLGYCPHGNGI